MSRQQLLYTLLLVLSFNTYASAQKVIPKLVLQEKEYYQVDSSNILLVDTLVMHDKAAIVFNQGAPAFMGANMATVGQNCRIVSKGLDGTRRRTGTFGADGLHGNATEINIHFASLGSLTIDTRGGDGVKGEDGIPETASTKKSDGDGSFKSIAPATPAKQGSAGGNGGNGGNLILTYSTNGFIPRFNQHRKQHAIIILQQGGKGGKPGKYGKAEGRQGADGKVKLTNADATQPAPAGAQE